MATKIRITNKLRQTVPEVVRELKKLSYRFDAILSNLGRV